MVPFSYFLGLPLYENGANAELQIGITTGVRQHAFISFGPVCHELLNCILWNYLVITMLQQ